VAHGTSLRGLVKHLDDISDSAIEQVEIPTGKPLIYELDQGLAHIRSFYLEADGMGTALRVPSRTVRFAS
jgi:2,3-bisphosphoglycerate-dependent phosphoglycerate mutase